MTDDAPEDNRQFEAVLNRLDALMKRSHPSAPAPEAGVAEDDGAAADVPVLTEVYQGALLQPVSVVEQDAPLLTEYVVPPPMEEAGPHAVETQPVDVSGQMREQDVERVVAELLPMLQELVEKLVKEELFYTQQNLTLRIGQEAEQALRQRLLEAARPK